MHFIYLSHSVSPFHQRGRELIFDRFRFTTCIKSSHLLKILPFVALARNLINRPRMLLQILGGWTPSHLRAEHLQSGNGVQTIWKTIYINKPRKFGCTLLKVKPKVSCYILFWKRQQSLCIMISYAESEEELSHFSWPITYYQAKRLLGGGNAICLSGSIFCLHHLPPPPNIHTDWKQRKLTFLSFASPSKEQGKVGKVVFWIRQKWILVTLAVKLTSHGI